MEKLRWRFGGGLEEVWMSFVGGLEEVWRSFVGGLEELRWRLGGGLSGGAGAGGERHSIGAPQGFLPTITAAHGQVFAMVFITTDPKTQVFAMIFTTIV